MEDELKELFSWRLIVTHVLCVHLKQWPIDRLRRRRPEFRHKRVVLIETVKSRQIIAHASPEVPHEICPGMVLDMLAVMQAGCKDGWHCIHCE